MRAGIVVVVVVAVVVAVGLGGRAPGRATAQTAARVTAGVTARGVGGASVSSGPFTVLAEPRAGVAPFLSMITGAHQSIELTMYELTDIHVEQALGGAAHRGVNVRVLLNGGYYSEREPTNDPAEHYLTAHGVHVHFSSTYFALTHQTLTVDGARSAVDAVHGLGGLLWSPGAAPSVVSMIRSARRSIALEDEEMAYSPATSALCAAARRGVAVTIVMTDESEWDEAFDERA